MVKSIIHVYQQRIKNNTKTGSREPPIIVRDYKKVRYGNTIFIKDKNGHVVAKLVYSPDKPLNCGQEFGLKLNAM